MASGRLPPIKMAQSWQNLIGLPPEIIQKVFLCCTTPSFFHASLSCKSLFEVAGTSREVLLHHLNEVPGILLGLHDSKIATKELFRILRRRGAAQLFGANFTADQSSFEFKNATVDTSASFIATGIDYMYINLAIVLKESLRLRLYEASDGTCILKELVECPYSDGKARILKVIQRRNTLSVLYSYIKTEEGELSEIPRPRKCILDLDDDASEEGTANVDSASYSSESDLMKTYYHLFHHNLFSNERPAMFQISAPFPKRSTSPLLVPIDLAVCSRLECAVLWDLPGAITPTKEALIILYRADSLPKNTLGIYAAHKIYPPIPPVVETNENTPSSRQPTNVGPLPPTPASPLTVELSKGTPRAIAFADSGQRLKIFAPGTFIPYDITRAHPTSFHHSQVPSASWFASRPWTRNLYNMHWTLTVPFFGSHVTRPISAQDSEDADEAGGERCTFSYLSLASTVIQSPKRLFKPGARIIPNSPLGKERDEAKILCILRGSHTEDPVDCSHIVETDTCPLEHAAGLRVVARLWGWSTSETSLAGDGTVASSGCGKRIAVADWNRVLIWSVQPDALIDEDFSEDEEDSDVDSDVDEEGMQSPVTTRNYAHGETRREPASYYTRTWDTNLKAWLVELRPVVLDVGEAVARQLVWRSVNELIVRTDRDIQLWDLGVNGTGKRSRECLDEVRM